MKNQQSTTEEQTLVLLKHSNVLRRLGPIRSRLAKSGHIVHARMIEANSDVMDVLCVHLKPVMKQATLAHFGGQMLAAFVVQGENVIARVSTLVGAHVNPELCEHNSIRYQMAAEFGIQITELSNGSIYINNFIHCTRTWGEAIQQIPVIINPNVLWLPL